MHVAGSPNRKGKSRSGKRGRVAVPPPGTSINPDPEQHQAALATAVAHEVSKGLDRELSMKGPRQILPAAALINAGPTDAGMDELAMLQVTMSSMSTIPSQSEFSFLTSE